MGRLAVSSNQRGSVTGRGERYVWDQREVLGGQSPRLGPQGTTVGYDKGKRSGGFE